MLNRYPYLQGLSENELRQAVAVFKHNIPICLECFNKTLIPKLTGGVRYEVFPEGSIVCRVCETNPVNVLIKLTPMTELELIKHLPCSAKNLPCSTQNEKCLGTPDTHG